MEAGEVTVDTVAEALEFLIQTLNQKMANCSETHVFEVRQIIEKQVQDSQKILVSIINHSFVATDPALVVSEVKALLNCIVLEIHGATFNSLHHALNGYAGIDLQKAQEKTAEYTKQVYQDARIQIHEYIQQAGEGAHGDGQVESGALDKIRSLAAKCRKRTSIETPDDAQKEKVAADQDLSLRRVQDLIKQKIEESEAKTLQTTSAANESLNAIHEAIVSHTDDIKSFKAEILNVDEKIKASRYPAHEGALEAANREYEVAKNELLTHVNKTMDNKSKQASNNRQLQSAEEVCDFLMVKLQHLGQWHNEASKITNKNTLDFSADFNNIKETFAGIDGRFQEIDSRTYALEKQVNELKQAPPPEATQPAIEKREKDLASLSPTPEEICQVIKEMIDEFASDANFAESSVCQIAKRIAIQQMDEYTLDRTVAKFEDVDDRVRQSEVQNYERLMETFNDKFDELSGMVKQSKEEVVEIIRKSETDSRQFITTTTRDLGEKQDMNAEAMTEIWAEIGNVRREIKELKNTPPSSPSSEETTLVVENKKSKIDVQVVAKNTPRKAVEGDKALKVVTASNERPKKSVKLEVTARDAVEKPVKVVNGQVAMKDSVGTQHKGVEKESNEVVVEEDSDVDDDCLSNAGTVGNGDPKDYDKVICRNCKKEG